MALIPSARAPSMSSTYESPTMTAARGVRRLLDRRETGRLVPAGVEHQPVPRPDPPVALGPELRPGPEEREVDVEQDGPEHASRIRVRRRDDLPRATDAGDRNV